MKLFYLMSTLWPPRTSMASFLRRRIKSDRFVTPISPHAHFLKNRKQSPLDPAPCRERPPLLHSVLGLLRLVLRHPQLAQPRATLIHPQRKLPAAAHGVIKFFIYSFFPRGRAQRRKFSPENTQISVTGGVKDAGGRGVGIGETQNEQGNDR